VREQGFLPPPPWTGPDPQTPHETVHDFRAEFPLSGAGTPFELRHYDPTAHTGNAIVPVDSMAAKDWKIAWDEPYLSATSKKGPPEPAKSLKIRDYLFGAYLWDKATIPTATTAYDPPLPSAEEVVHTDARIANPTDAAFEAAVRGAVNQFQGLPGSKFSQEVNSYDQTMREAFGNPPPEHLVDVTKPANPNNPGDLGKLTPQLGETARQLRGMIVHDLVVGLQQFAQLPVAQQVWNDGNAAVLNAALQSLPKQYQMAFHLGLVFRYSGPKPPKWLDEKIDDSGARPTIKQRSSAQEMDVDHEQAAPVKTVRAFNLKSTDFRLHPPHFDEVRHYSDANTVAIAWELRWSASGNADLVGAQADVEHHLKHYLVRRRALNEASRDVVFTIKNADAIHETKSADNRPILNRLKARFKLVDHFTAESAERIATLPATGLSYVYTITPVDQTGSLGDPLTLVATRYPTDPPLVPADAQLIVQYTADSIEAEAQSDPIPVVLPTGITVEWSDPGAHREGPAVLAADYFLIFRRQETLPIGNYGLDGALRPTNEAILPTSSARPLPSDVRVLIPRPDPTQNRFDVKAALESAKIAPDMHTLWKPEAWQIFIQTVSANGVPSAMARVQCTFNFSEGTLIDPRKPAELEWLPQYRPLQLLPPRDMEADTGIALVPMPFADSGLMAANYRFERVEGVGTPDAQLAGRLTFRHPTAATPCIKFRWNQGPSSPGLDLRYRHPLALYAGYRLFELDLDAHTDQTFDDSQRTAGALRLVQHLQLVPAGDLALLPNDTRAVSQWEAWYPSAVYRRVLAEGQQSAVARKRGIDPPETPWYSWRDSHLVWPVWPGLTDAPTGPVRDSNFHPLLEYLSALLELDVTNESHSTPFHGLPFKVDVQPPPPADAGGIEDGSKLIDLFLQNNSEKGDPYGWRILQRFGLAMTFMLRDRVTGDPVLAADPNDPVHASADGATPPGRDSNPPKRMLLQRVQEAIHRMAGESETSLFQTVSTQLSQLRDDPQTPSGAALIALIDVIVRPLNAFGLLTQGSPQNGRINSLRIALKALLEQYALKPIELSKEAILSEALRIIQAREEALLGATPSGLSQTFKERFFAHLHVELLVQPGQCIALGQLGEDISGQIQPDALLATLQVSLRPAVAQTHRYWATEIAGPPLQAQPVLATLIDNGGSHAATSECVIVSVGAGTPISATIEPSSNGTPLSLPLPPDGRIHLLARAPQGFTPHLTSLGATAVPDFVPIPITGPETGAAYVDRPFDPLTFADFQPTTDPKEQLDRFRRYVCAFYHVPVPPLPADVPGVTQAADLYAVYRDWARRFMEQTGFIEPPANLQTDMDTPADGPWLASAYPRASMPAYATPDASGRATYFHLLNDQYAHTLRYYMLPYSRYDMLREGVLNSAVLFPQASKSKVALHHEVTAELIQALRDAKLGALDVVLSRIRSVASPALIASRRLDPPSIPGKVTPPGPTWEVILAEHQEQTLSDRNQTLARRLAWQQITHSLERVFQYAPWPDALEDLINYYRPALDGGNSHQILLEPVPDNSDLVAIPQVYPAEIARLDPDDMRVKLPARLADFQQAVLAMQWEGLPFFYEHKLLLAAQTATTVSDTLQTLGRDYQYISPPPDWTLSARAGAADRYRVSMISLSPFWYSLTQQAQEGWPYEKPQTRVAQNGVVTLRPSAVPDPGVVYQVIVQSQGNTEVQAEILVSQEPDTARPTLPAVHYQVRKMGRRFDVEITGMLPPASADPLDLPSARYNLLLNLKQTTRLELKPTDVLFDVATPTGDKYNQAEKLFTGVMTRLDRFNLILGTMPELRQLYIKMVDAPDTLTRAKIDGFLAVWFAAQAVSAKPDWSLSELSPSALTALQGKISFPETPVTVVLWKGNMTLGVGSQAEALGVLANNCDPSMQAALMRLLNQTGSLRYDFADAAPRGDDKPAGLPMLEFKRTPDGHGFVDWTLEWTGGMTEGEKEIAVGYRPQSSLYQTTFQALLTLIKAATFDAAVYAPVRPHPKRTEPPLPDGFEMDYVVPDIATSGNWTLKWTQATAPADWSAVTALKTGNADPIFDQGIDDLIAAVTATPGPQQVTIGFAWPRWTSKLLQEELSLPATSLEPLKIPPVGSAIAVRWQGADNLPMDPADLLQKINNDPRLAGDPITAILTSLMNLIAAKHFVAPFFQKPRPDPKLLPALLKDQLLIGEYFLRAETSLLPDEIAALKRTYVGSDPDIAAIDRLAINLDNRATIDAVYRDWYTLEAVSQAVELPTILQETVDFIEDPTGGKLLRYHGLMTPEERTQLLSLFLNDSEAIKRLAERSLQRGMGGGELLVRTYRGTAAPSESKEPSSI
jgi:hypothetical protein